MFFFPLLSLPSIHRLPVRQKQYIEHICWYEDGLPSATLSQHYLNIAQSLVSRRLISIMSTWMVATIKKKCHNCQYLYLCYAQIYWFYNGTVILLFLARFCKTLFLPEFLSNQLEILTQHSQSSQVFCYDFSKTSIMFFRIYLDPSTLETQKAVSAYL